MQYQGETTNVFISVAAVVFQITFYAEMHVNDIFFIFNINTSKWSKKYKPH